MNKTLAARYMIPEVSLASESAETSAAFSWIALQQDERLRMTFHPASEAKRSVVMGKSLKMQGMLPGIPDVVNPIVPFMLEMKVRRNAPSQYQAWWLTRGVRMGISCGVAYNAGEAIDFFEAVLRDQVEDAVAYRRLRIMMADWAASDFVADPWISRGR